MKLQRYEQLTAALTDKPCGNLVEVGTWNGRRACELAFAALRRSREVSYQGFDLFEALTKEDLEAELSKRPPSRAEVERLLRAFEDRVSRRGRLLPRRRRSFHFALHQGYTRDTLPAFRLRYPDFRADFVFIDGGHRVETIDNDWRHCSELLDSGGVIFLDDFYGDKRLAERFGCNTLIAALSKDTAWDVEVLPAADLIPDLGTIQIARVTRVSGDV